MAVANLTPCSPPPTPPQPPLHMHTHAHTGSPEPLGPSRQFQSTNFAVYSGGASAMSLVLLNPADSSRQEIPMNKSGGCLAGGCGFFATCFFGSSAGRVWWVYRF